MDGDNRISPGPLDCLLLPLVCCNANKTPTYYTYYIYYTILLGKLQAM